MSATDDAPPSTTVKPGGSHPGAALLVALAGALAGAVCALFAGPRIAPGRLPLFESQVAWHGAAPAAGAWPHEVYPGASAIVRGTAEARRLAVRAPDAASAEALAAELAFDLASGRDPFERRRAALRAGLSRAPSPDPRPLTPPAECAARLRGWAEAWRGLAGADAGDAAARSGTPAPSEALRALEAEIAQRALEADPASLEYALERLARREREQLLSAPSLRDGVELEELRRHWAFAAGRRAEDLESLAVALEGSLSEEERARVAGSVPGVVRVAESQLADPGALTRGVARGPRPDRAHPVAMTWIALGLAGAIAGGGAAAPFARPASRRRRVRTIHRMSGPVPNAPRAVGFARAWLQIVSGRGARAIEPAVLALAKRLLDRGAPVLIVDGGRRLDLHRALAGEARLGLEDCLRGTVPALGVVQSAGASGLFLLGRGASPRDPDWTQLDRVLEELRPHFGHVVLALEASAPGEIGSMLAGRLVDGWWAGPVERSARAAQSFVSRLGIAVHFMDLSDSEQVSREADPDPGELRIVPPQPTASPKLDSSPVSVPDPLPGTAVLDSELQVRERLRFLIWMRRVQAEGRREALEPLSRG